MSAERQVAKSPEHAAVPRRAPSANAVEAATPTSTLQSRLGNLGAQAYANGVIARAAAPGAASGSASNGSYAVSEPEDAQEREADRVAEMVMRCEAGGEETAPRPAGTHVRRSVAPVIARDATGDDEPGVHGALSSHIDALRGGGSALPEGTRTFFEERFGADLGHVRVHADSRAAETSDALGARAFTVGNDIAFASGQYAPESEDGRHLLAHELTHVLQQSGASSLHPARVHRWEWPWEKRDRERAEAIKASEAIFAITDFSTYTEAQRMDMVRTLIIGSRADNQEELAIVRVWNSFGADLPRVASANAIRWFESRVRVARLVDSLPEAQRIRDAFAGDVLEIALRNTSINLDYAEAEMQRLGLPRYVHEVIREPTAAQAGELARLQVAAEGLAKLQAAQEVARTAAVGYQQVSRPSSFGDEGEQDMGRSTPRDYRRVKFDPDRPPPLETLPRRINSFYDDKSESWVTFTTLGLPPPRSMDDEVEAYKFMLSEHERLTAIVPYAPIKVRYDEATAAIAAHLAAFPALYALTVQNNAEVIGKFAGAKTPRAARDQLAAAFLELLRNIDRTRSRLGDGDLDPLDLLPLHDRMFEGKEMGPSEIPWSQAMPRSIAEQLRANHSLDRALKRLLMQSIAQIAFVFAPVAGPLAIPLLLVGVGTTGALLYIDTARYQALADAARSSAKPGTELVTKAQVDEARMAVEADRIALALGLLALGAAAGRFAVQRFSAYQHTRQAALRQRLITQVGEPTGVESRINRAHEMPYGIPERDVKVVAPGSPLDVSKLDPKRRYLWVIDEQGNFRIADEGRGAQFPKRGTFEPSHPLAGETPLKHGDLTPGPGGQSRGLARAGGDFRPQIGRDGKPTGLWEMTNDSSYTFARADGRMLGASNLDAAKALLETTGTDVSKIVTKNLMQ